MLGGNVLKKLFALLLAAVLLTGCTAQKTFETVNDSLDCIVPEAKDIKLTLPDDASVMTLESGENDKLYICNGYTVSLSVAETGDINKTLLQTTGFPKESLTIVETVSKGMKRYDGVWTCVGENGEQVGNITVIDDGTYHYVMSILGDASASGDMSAAWNEIKRSFSVTDTAQEPAGT